MVSAVRCWPSRKGPLPPRRQADTRRASCSTAARYSHEKSRRPGAGIRFGNGLIKTDRDGPPVSDDPLWYKDGGQDSQATERASASRLHDHRAEAQRLVGGVRLRTTSWCASPCTGRARERWCGGSRPETDRQWKHTAAAEGFTCGCRKCLPSGLTCSKPAAALPSRRRKTPLFRCPVERKVRPLAFALHFNPIQP